MKKLIAWMLCVVTVLALFIPCAMAAGVSAGDARVVIGANLTDAQKDQVYSDFGVTRGSVTELSVNIDEERSRLGGLISADKIGSYSLSCIFIRVRKEGEGIDIQTNNINWCSADMYKNALLDRRDHRRGSPHHRALPRLRHGGADRRLQSGHEDITGTTISEDAKSASTQELVVTGNLAEMIGSEDATQLIKQNGSILL